MGWLRRFFHLFLGRIGMEKELIFFDDSISIDPDDLTWVSIGEHLRVSIETDEHGTAIARTQPVILISTIAGTHEFPHDEPYLAAAIRCKAALSRRPKLRR